MKSTKVFIIALFFILAPLARSQSIWYEGQSYHINGINIPWNSFGSDVGTHYQWGAFYDSSWFENTFSEFEKYKLNCARLWIHCDGRTSPEFTDSGAVWGLDSNFFSNLDDIFLRAEKHHMMLIPCLWSFDMTKDYRSTAGQYAGWHADLIRDTTKIKTYIKNVLIPMVQRYTNQCNLLAWEIINEPEWSMAIPGGGKTIQQVKDYEMQRFVGMQAAAIHEYSTKMVTLGSASIKWNSDAITSKTPVVGNYWSDSALQLAYPHALAYLDFYQIHYYDWMYDLNYDPFDLSYPLSFWKLDKAVLIGESGNSWAYTVQEMIDNGYSNKYGGILYWSYAANDGYGSWDDCKSELNNFSTLHEDSISFMACDSTSSVKLIKRIKDGIGIYTYQNQIKIEHKNYTYWEIVNFAGQRMAKGEINKNAGETFISLSNFPSGLYIFRVNNDSQCIFIN